MLFVATLEASDSANSYASVVQADAYFLPRFSAWAGFDLEKKQRLLIKASDYIDSRWLAKLPGEKLSVSQAMQWPRKVSHACKTGIHFPIAELSRATLEYAMIAASRELISMPTVDAGTGTAMLVTRKKVGPLEIQYQPAATASTASKTDQGWLQFPAADSIMKSLLSRYQGNGYKVIR